MRTLLVALAVLATSVLPAAAETCQLVKLTSVPLQEVAAGVYVVPVTVNGTARKFLVDTGGVFTAIQSNVARELGLVSSPAPRGIVGFGVGGDVITRVVSVSDFKVGELPAVDGPMWLLPEGFLWSEIDGILAPNYLKVFDLDFDMAAKTLNLFSPDHCKGKVVYWTRDYAEVPFRLVGGDHMMVEATLDGKELEAVFDTGASRTLLDSSKARQLFGLKEGSPGLEPVPDDIVVHQYRFQSLEIGGMSVRNPLIYLKLDKMKKAYDRRYGTTSDRHPLSDGGLEGPALMLGMSILKELHFYIAYKERTIYLSGAKATHASAQ